MVYKLWHGELWINDGLRHCELRTNEWRRVEHRWQACGSVWDNRRCLIYASTTTTTSRVWPIHRFHPILVQCISEIHERGHALLSRTGSQRRNWGPTPIIQSPCSPVLPPEVPQFVLGGTTTYSQKGLNMLLSSLSSQAYIHHLLIQRGEQEAPLADSPVPSIYQLRSTQNDNNGN